MNNAQLDEQHITLLEISRELLRTIDDRPLTDGRILILLGDLAGSYDQHVELEEAILETNQCPTLADHRREHVLAKQELGDYLQQAQGNSVDRNALRSAVVAWMNHHFFEADLTARQFLRTEK